MWGWLEPVVERVADSFEHYWYTGSWKLWSAGGLPIFLVGIGLSIYEATNWKRDGLEGPGQRITQDVIYHFNATALRGGDVHRLHDLQMEVMPSGAAFFSVPGEFNVSGMVTGLRSKPRHGLRKGHLSFSVPGVFEAPVEAIWYSIPNNITDALEDKDEKVEKGFHRVREMHKAAREHAKKMGEGERPEFDVVLAGLAAAEEKAKEGGMAGCRID